MAYTINNTKIAKITEKTSATEVTQIYTETVVDAIKTLTQIGSFPAKTSLKDILTFLVNASQAAGVSAITINSGEQKTGVVNLTLADFGSIAFTSTDKQQISTNQSDIATLRNNLSTNTYGFALKSEIASVLTYKGTKATTGELPQSDNKTGDVWHVTADGGEYAWNGSAWEALGSSVNLSNYVTNTQLSSVSNTATSALNKATTNETSINNIISGTTAVGKATNADNATSATAAGKLSTARSISLSGDATGTTSFDGSSNATINTTLKNSGVSAGTYSAVKVNSKGIVEEGKQSIVFADALTDSALDSLVIGGIAIIG